MSTAYFVILFILILILIIEINFSFHPGTYIENFFFLMKPKKDGNWSNRRKHARYKAQNKKRVEKKKASLNSSQKKIAMNQKATW